MLREIYLRDPSDGKYKPHQVETNSKLEALLNKIRMILLTNKGEVLGEPTFGMNLEDYLFNTIVNEAVLRDEFYAQINKYIPEKDYSIDLTIEKQTIDYKDVIYLYILINGQKEMAILF